MNHKHAYTTLLLLLTLLATPVYGHFKVVGYNYAKAKEVIKERVKNGICEPVEGIWKSSNGIIYAIERFEDERFPENLRYRVIQLSGKNAEPGMVDYFLELTNYDEYYRIWGKNPFTLTNEPVGRECYMTFSPGYFFFKQQLDTVVFTREYPRIDALPAPKYSTGSGFAITSDGYIVTNHHVIQAATNIYIYGVNGLFDQYYQARIVASDSINDIAIIKIEDTTFTSFGPIPYGLRRDDPIEGEFCMAISYPKINSLGINPKTTTGIISATTDSNQPSRCQTTVPIEHGSSGSPLFDKDGNILAINSARHSVYYTKLAVKNQYLCQLIEQCDELKGFDLPVVSAGRQLTEIVATNKNFVVLILTRLPSNDQQEYYYILDEEKPLEETDPFARAEQFFYAGQYREAVDLLTRILTEDRDNCRAYYLRGCCWERLNTRENAIVDYRQALRSFDKKRDGEELQALIYCNLALNQIVFEAYTEAMENIEKSLRIKVDDFSLMVKGLTCYHLKEYDAAIKILSDIIDNRELQSTVYYYRGLSFLAIDKSEIALSDMKNAAECGNQSAAEWLNNYSSSLSPKP